MIFCSPAEPENLKLLGTVDSETETIWGADFMWATPYGLALVQRKRFPSDYYASNRGGDRLAKEIKQFQDQFEHSRWRYLILELDPNLKGKSPWDENGNSKNKRIKLTRKEVSGLTESLDFFHNIKTRWTCNEDDTGSLIKILYEYTCKDYHSGYIPHRVSPRELSVEQRAGDWREWILTGFPGIGSTLARSILKVYPDALQWKPGIDLCSVPKIGELKKRMLMEYMRPRNP